MPSNKEKENKIDSYEKSEDSFLLEKIIFQLFLDNTWCTSQINTSAFTC